jgi:hypothetical protein
MRWIAASLRILACSPAFADTGMIIARQPAAPVQMTQATFGLTDALQSANTVNRSAQVVSAYRVGWESVTSGRHSFHTGAWMNLPAGAKPGAAIAVPAQGIALDRQAESMVFYVAAVKFADGGRWNTSYAEIRKIGRQAADPAQFCGSIPMVCSHVSISSGHLVMGSFVGRRPYAWLP